MDVIFNKHGIPLLAFGKQAFVSTVGTSSSSSSSAAPPNEEPESFNGQKIYPWGSTNKFPIEAEETIRKSSVLNSGLKYKLQMILGQGIFPANVTGYKDDGQEVLEVVEDKTLQKLLRGRVGVWNFIGLWIYKMVHYHLGLNGL